jgi:hypothetical protein
LPQGHGDWKFFYRHKDLMTKRFFITIVMWRLNLIAIWSHRLNLVTIEQRLWISVAHDGSGPFSITIWELLNGNWIFSQPFDGDRFLKRFLKVYVFKCNFQFTF